MNSTTKSKLSVKLKLLGVVPALFVWQALSMAINSDILFAGPWDVIKALLVLCGESLFWQSVWFTLWHIIAGYLLGALLAIVLALLSDRFKLVEALVWPYMITIKSVPVASIVVICLVWMRARNLSIFTAFLIVLPIVYSNVFAGLKARDSELEDVARVYNVTGFEKIKTVLLPELAPYLVSAASVSAGVAWKAGVAAEVIGTPNGSIGRQLYLSKTYLDTADLFAWTLTIVLISTLFEKLLVFVTKKALKAE